VHRAISAILSRVEETAGPGRECVPLAVTDVVVPAMSLPMEWLITGRTRPAHSGRAGRAMDFRNPARVTCVEAGVRHATQICSWTLLITMCATATAGCSASAGSAPAAAKGHSAAAAIEWRAVSYHGVHVEVPAGWPVVDGMHTLFGGGPFPARPTAFVGPQDNRPPSCPAPLPGAPAGRVVPPGPRRDRDRPRPGHGQGDRQFGWLHAAFTGQPGGGIVRALGQSGLDASARGD